LKIELNNFVTLLQT